VSEFLEAYRRLLQRAVDEMWAKIRWIEKRDEKGRRRLIPIIPKDNNFKKRLRNLLLEGWGYSKHYVDSAIKQAYSMLKSWRRGYLKGERRRKKPVIRKRFVRIKETLYTYKDGKIKVSVKPHEEYLVFDISKAWFLKRAKGELGELILGEKYLTVTFRFKKDEEEVKGKIAWDCNERSLDGFSLSTGWIRIDLTKLFHIHRVYEVKRKRLQQKASKKPSLKRVLAKYSKREKNRARDLVHKLTTFMSRKFKGYIHGFEDLRKERMLNGSKEHNRNISKVSWKTIIALLSYRSKVVLLNPKNSTRRCSRCGMINAPKGAVYECRCGLRMDRQLNGAVNLYLQMEGLPPTPRLFDELMKSWRGFALTGDEAVEGPNELGRGPRLLNPKSYAVY
jgi:putative transposase